MVPRGSCCPGLPYIYLSCFQLRYINNNKIFHEICRICRGRNFVNKFETSSRYDPRRGDRRIQVREGRGRRSTRGTSREQEEERDDSGTG